jgi:hypothetical protein
MAMLPKHVGKKFERRISREMSYPCEVSTISRARFDLPLHFTPQFDFAIGYDRLQHACVERVLVFNCLVLVQKVNDFARLVLGSSHSPWFIAAELPAEPIEKSMLPTSTLQLPSIPNQNRS